MHLNTTTYMEGIKAIPRLLEVVFLFHAEKKSPVNNKSSSVLKFPAGVEGGVSLGAAFNC